MGDFVTAQKVLAAATALSSQMPVEVRDAIMDLQAAILQGGGGEDAVVVDDFGHDAQSIRDAEESRIEQGKTGLLFNQGTWNIDPDTLALPDEEGAVLQVQSGTRILMRPSALVVQQGLGVAPDGESPYYHVFKVGNGVTNVYFDGINAAGEKPHGEYTYNHQSSIIDVQWFGEDTGAVTVINSSFRDLWGFPVHSRADQAERVHAILNKVLRCSNGINICADFSIQLFNQIQESEGLEFSGAWNLVAFNLIKNGLGCGFSAGGNGGIEKPGSMVVCNQVDGVSEVIGQPGIGIIAAENFCRATIAYNHIQRCALGGIQLSGAVGNNDVQVNHNQCYSNGYIARDNEGGSSGIYFAGGNRHRATGNVCRDLGISGYAQMYGFVGENANDCRVYDNDFSGTFHDASFQNMLRTRERDNWFVNSTQETSASTYIDTDYSWRA